VTGSAIGGGRGGRWPIDRVVAVLIALAVAVFVAVALLAARPVAAAEPPEVRPAPARVVVLRAAEDSALTRQGTTLLVAELQAAGFEVIEAERRPDHDVRDDIEAISARLQPVATFAIRAAVGENTATELWLEDRVTGKLVIRRVEPGAGADASADLALKAVELLHGSLLEVAVQPSAAGQPPPPEVTRLIENDAAAAGPRARHALQGIGVAAGASVLGGAGLAAAYAPLLRLSFGGGSGLAARVSASGLGSTPEVHAQEGGARIHQTLILAEGLRLFRPGRRFQPLAGVAAGIYRVSGDGTGISSLFPGETGTATAAAAGALGGIAARLTSRIALVADATALALLPSTRIVIAQHEAARAGGLALLGTLSLCGLF
jgi:hypothetical protein